MKVYSDSLTRSDLFAAAKVAHVGLDVIPMRHSKVRAHGWTVQLSGSSPHPRNSGKYGADWSNGRPATWDEHGRWMALLFAKDANARIAYYDGAENFHEITKGAYRNGN